MFPSLDQAMAQFEGFGTPGTIATRQNNPGNVSYGPFAISQGATGPGANNIAVFPNTQTGFSAMDNLIQHYANQGYNIQDLISAWSPASAKGNSQQSTQNYTNYVASKTRASPNTPVSALQAGQDALKAAWGAATGILGSSGGGIGAINAGEAGAISGATGVKVEPAGQTFSYSRILVLIVGVIAIGGAIFLYKPSLITEPLKGAALV